MAGPSILLVEDEFLIRVTLELALEDAGYGVVTAANGEQAISSFDEDPARFGAVITDIRLGHGNTGWDVARHCREVNADLPILYITGDSAADWEEQGVSGSLLLTKPFTFDRVVATLECVLKR